MNPRVALITGGSSGIGAATADRLLKDGYQVAITGRSQEKLDQCAEKLGRPRSLLTVDGDAGQPDDVRRAVATTVDRFGRLDTAIANAGYATHDDLENGDPSGWPHMVLTNVLGPALLIHEVLPALKESRGRIVLVSSVAGRIFTAGNIYGATKWALSGLAENTRLMVAPYGIGVTLVSPGATQTDFFARVGGSPADRRGGYLPAERLGDAIAWAVQQPADADVSDLTIRTIGSPL